MSVRFQLSMFLTSGLLSLAISQSAYPQQSEPVDPQASKPPRLILKSAPPNSAGDAAPLKIEQLSDLASRLLHYTGDAGCQQGNCRILVTNFILTTGYASSYGIQAADEMAQEFARQDKSVQVIDRKSFKNQFRQLEEEQTPIFCLYLSPSRESGSIRRE